MNIITRDELKQMMDRGDDFVIIDVLSPDQYAEVHIKGAVNIPLNRFSAEAPQRLPDKNKKVVVYCASFDCTASEKAATTLEKMDYNNVLRYEGGIADWIVGDLPLESDVLSLKA